MKNKTGGDSHMNSDRSSGTKRTQYIIAGGILLAGCVLSAIILFRPFSSGGKQSADDPGAAAEPAVEETAEPPQGTTPEDFVLSFFDADGDLIEQRTVIGGSPALPPAAPGGEGFFRGWSGELFDIEGDMDIYPVFKALGETVNAVYADYCYADISGDISVTVEMGGAVDCSDFIIELAYDRDLLTFCGARPQITGLEVSCNPENGAITLLLEDSDGLTAPTERAELHFSSEAEGQYSTSLPILTREIHSVRDGVKIYTDSTAFDSKLYLLDFD